MFLQPAHSAIPARLLRQCAALLLLLAVLAIAYKIKRVLQINLFEDIDVIPEETIKALIHWDALKAFFLSIFGRAD